MRDIDVEAAVPAGPATARFRKWLAVLIGLAALSAAVLSFVETNSDRQEERAFVKASRGAIDLSVALAGSGPRLQFEADSLRQSLFLESRASGRAIGALGESGLTAQFALAVADTEPKAAKRLRNVAGEMSSLPTEASGVDEATIEVLRSDPSTLGPALEAQNEAVDDAGRYGSRQERSMFGLGLVAIAASLLGLAGLMGANRGGRISLVTAGLALAVADVWTLSAFVF